VQTQEKQAQKVEDWTKVLKFGEYARQMNADAETQRYRMERHRQQGAPTRLNLPHARANSPCSHGSDLRTDDVSVSARTFAMWSI
jgi:hypothetical protein